MAKLLIFLLLSSLFSTPAMAQYLLGGANIDGLNISSSTGDSQVRGLGAKFKWIVEGKKKEKASLGVKTEYKFSSFSDPSRYTLSDRNTHDLRLFPYAARLMSKRTRIFGGPTFGYVPVFNATTSENAKFTNVPVLGISLGAAVLLPDWLKRSNVLSVQAGTSLWAQEVRKEEVKFPFAFEAELRSTRKGIGPFASISYQSFEWGPLDQTMTSFLLGISVKY